MFNLNNLTVGLNDDIIVPINLLSIEKPNLDYIDSLADGDEEFRLSLLSHLSKELPIELDKLKNSIENNIPLEQADSIHKIKHKFAMVGMKHHNEVSQVVESNIRNGQNMDDHSKLLIVGINRMIDFVDESINKT